MTEVLILVCHYLSLRVRPEACLRMLVLVLMRNWLGVLCLLSSEDQAELKGRSKGLLETVRLMADMMAQ